MKKILILGSTGQLGKAATDILGKNSDYEVSVSGRGANPPSPLSDKVGTEQNPSRPPLVNGRSFEFDLATDDLALTLGDYKPDVILLAAAFTHVDGCELDPKKSYIVNVEGVKKVTDYCKKFGVKLVFFSTDYIFDGENGPYSESDKPNPLNVYGLHKLEAENYIRENLVNYLILRVAWLADTKYDDKNFVAQVLRKMKNGEILKISDDQFGNPSLTRNVVENIGVLIDQRITGIFNLCGKEMIDRFNYSKKIAKTFNFDENLVMAAKPGDYVVPAKRPTKAGMKVDKIEKIPGIHLLTIDEMLNLMKNG